MPVFAAVDNSIRRPSGAPDFAHPPAKFENIYCLTLKIE
jgi:hypothetical protein